MELMLKPSEFILSMGFGAKRMNGEMLPIKLW
jgi:hypothetical protein